MVGEKRSMRIWRNGEGSDRIGVGYGCMELGGR